MDLPNSHVEVYLELVTRLVECDPLDCTSPKDIRRDIETIQSRYREEGLSFLTKSLAQLGRALDQGMMTSRFSIPRGWKHAHGNRSRPAFMQAYFNRVFGCDGSLLDDADPGAVKHLRQVLYAMYKLELPYQKEEERLVIDAFVANDDELKLARDDTRVMSLVDTASYIARNILSDFDHKNIMPRHGPGAVATGERLDDKWRFSRLYRGIHQVYPYYDYFVIGGGRELVDRLKWYKSLSRLETGVAKVVLVPKDSRGPRLISAEPLEYQWIQQGLGRALMSHLEADRLTAGHINFTHQTINQRLALESSLSDEFSTLDLKDASDLVSLELVQEVFKHNPEFLRAIEATRSTATKLPDGRVITLKKFAPMGSALCFPVEALIFYVIIVAAIHKESRLLPVEIGKRVYVYGDDIIVPREWAHVSMHALELVGLKVNRAKSCITGPFKESCGTDAFKGVVVTPLRVRTPWSGRSSDGAALASYTSLANSLREKGYGRAFAFLKDLVETTFGKIPFGTFQASYPCWLVASQTKALQYNLLHFKWRYSSEIQQFQFSLLRLQPKKEKTKLDCWPRLLRNSVSGPIEDPSTVVVPRSTKIKRGWTTVY